MIHSLTPAAMRARTSTYVVMFLNGHVYFRNLSLCTRYLKLAKMIERLQNVSLTIYSSLDYTTFNAIGNQIKAGGVHYNVAWTEGLNACDNNVSIAPESSPVAGATSRSTATRTASRAARPLAPATHRHLSGSCARTGRSLGPARKRKRSLGAVGVRMML